MLNQLKSVVFPSFSRKTVNLDIRGFEYVAVYIGILFLFDLFMFIIDFFLFDYNTFGKISYNYDIIRIFT